MDTPDDKPVPMCTAPAVSVDEMPAGRELDALVAEKVMGLKWDERRCRHCGWPLVEEGKGPGCWPSNCSERPMRKGEDMADRPAHYSTNMDAAWCVVEKVGLIVGPWFGGQWFAVLPGTMNANTPGAPTAPLAICRAALKAVGR